MTSWDGYDTHYTLATPPSILLNPPFTPSTSYPPSPLLSGAPVTSWDGYDTHYTERYMGLPQENVQVLKLVVVVVVAFVLNYTFNTFYSPTLSIHLIFYLLLLLQGYLDSAVMSQIQHMPSHTNTPHQHTLSLPYEPPYQPTLLSTLLLLPSPPLTVTTGLSRQCCDVTNPTHAFSQPVDAGARFDR